MRTLLRVTPLPGWRLEAVFADGATRTFDVTPLLDCEAFAALRDPAAFSDVRQHGYYVEWGCGADLSADTLYLDGEPGT